MFSCHCQINVLPIKFREKFGENEQIPTIFSGNSAHYQICITDLKKLILILFLPHLWLYGFFRNLVFQRSNEDSIISDSMHYPNFIYLLFSSFYNMPAFYRSKSKLISHLLIPFPHQFKVCCAPNQT